MTDLPTDFIARHIPSAPGDPKPSWAARLERRIDTHPEEAAQLVAALTTIHARRAEKQASVLFVVMGENDALTVKTLSGKTLQHPEFREMRLAAMMVAPPAAMLLLMHHENGSLHTERVILEAEMVKGAA